jgi:Ring finger domain
MDDCSVCCEPLNRATGHCTLACHHSFHIACLTRWTTENPSCPLCRRELARTEAPHHAPTVPTEPTEPERGWELTTSVSRLMIWSQSAPPAPPATPPPAAPDRMFRIGGGLIVKESEVNLVVEHSGASRTEAIRALRHTSGDVVDAIVILTSSPPPPQTPAPEPPRDPMDDPSDDQATAWFLQHLFDDYRGYGWNGHWDLIHRMRNNRRKDRYWFHEDFQMLMNETPRLDTGYYSA